MSQARTIPRAISLGVVTYTIKVDGEPLSRSVNIVSIAVSNEVNRIPTAIIQVLDGNPAKEDFPVSNEDWLIPGKEIEIFTGFRSEEESIFKGIIIKHSIKIRPEASPQLIIECKDKAVKLTIDKRNRYFEDKKDSEAIEEILGERTVDADIEATTEAHKELVQFNCTDWDFIQTRAEMNGMFCITDAGKISVKKPALTEEPVLEALFGSTILDFDAEMDSRWQYSSVETSAWDAGDQQMLKTTAEEPGVKEIGNLPATDLAAISEIENYQLHHSGSLSNGQLQQWANAALLKSRLAKIRGRAKFAGTALVKPGTLIKVSGVGDRFNGDVFVSGVRHDVKSGNWTTHVQFGLSPRWFAQEHEINAVSASALLPAIKGLHIGIVTDLEDPEAAYRVKVKIPAISMDEEGTWARMCSLDAGNDRGIFFRPEINDEVIVGFLNEDPRYAVILGLLHSSAKTAPLPQDNNNHQKGIITRSKMKMVFDDDTKSIVIDTPAGKKIIIDEDAAKIEISDENSNKITMESSGITIEAAKALTLKAGTELKAEAAQINISASAACKVEGSGSLEVSSSGTATVKGSMVMIN